MYELILKGNQKPIIDILIASTAISNNLTLITSDTDFVEISRVSNIQMRFLKS